MKQLLAALAFVLLLPVTPITAVSTRKRRTISTLLPPITPPSRERTAPPVITTSIASLR